MTANHLLIGFLVFSIAQYLLERFLGHLNFRFYNDPKNQREAAAILNISPDNLSKSVRYANDRYHLGVFREWFSTTVFFVFLVMGGFGFFEATAKTISGGESQMFTGLLFFFLVGVCAQALSLPFDYYATFVVEEKHGFNRQTRRRFVLDLLKSAALAMIFGGVLLSILLAIMATTGDYWWILAWVALTLFSLVTAWLFPTFLAPLFNKFRPLEEGDLSVKIRELASAVKFPTSGVFVMDASTRSSHGNAYFTGIFGEKRIVLFDTLLSALRTDEIIAVLAHELGHFKLNHVRWSLIRGSVILGVGFFLMSLCLPIEAFYRAFGFDGISNYAALIVFSLWFGLFNFFLQPLSSYISRKNEFAADRFASQFPSGGQNLREALLKLREQNHSVPVTHPWYSLYYYSHPPIVERLKLL